MKIKCAGSLFKCEDVEAVTPGLYFDVLIPGSTANPFEYGYNMGTRQVN